MTSYDNCCLRIIDVSTLAIFDHESWPQMSRSTLSRLVQRNTLSSTEGQLYKALLVWADHWIKAGYYQSLQVSLLSVRQ